MKQRLVISVFFGLLALTFGCAKDQSRFDSKPADQASNLDVASTRKEIIAQNVLAAQLAANHEFEPRPFCAN